SRTLRSWRCRGPTTLAALALRQLRRLCVCRVFRLGPLRGWPVVIAQRDRHVTKVSLLSISTSLRRWSHTTAVLRRSTIDKCRAHPEIVRVERDVRLLSNLVGVGNRRSHALLDMTGCPLLRKAKNRQ